MSSCGSSQRSLSALVPDVPVLKPDFVSSSPGRVSRGPGPLRSCCTQAGRPLQRASPLVQWKVPGAPQGGEKGLCLKECWGPRVQDRLCGRAGGRASYAFRPSMCHGLLPHGPRSNPEASPLPHFRGKRLHLFGEIKSSHLSRRALGAAHSHHHAGTQGPATLDSQGLRLGKLSRNAFAFFF